MRSPTAPGARSLDIALPKTSRRSPSCLLGGRPFGQTSPDGSHLLCPSPLRARRSGSRPAGGDVRRSAADEGRARAAGEPLRPRSRRSRHRDRRLRHRGPAQLDRLVRGLRGLLEAGGGAATGVGQAARQGAVRDRRPRRIEGRRRRRAGKPSRHDVPAWSATGRRPSLDDGPLPDAVSPAWKAPTSGGSTGRPKLIVAGEPSLIDTDAAPSHGLPFDGCLVMPGPLYHNGPALMSCQALLAGCHVVLLERFDAEATLAAIAELPGRGRLPRPDDDEADLAAPRGDQAGLRPVVAADGLAPGRAVPDVAEGGVDRVARRRAHLGALRRDRGPGRHRDHRRRVAGASGFGRAAVIGEFMIADLDGNPLPPGEKGEVWLRNTSGKPTYHYIGAEPRTLDGGWESLGDMGWCDEDGLPLPRRPDAGHDPESAARTSTRPRSRRPCWSTRRCARSP